MNQTERISQYITMATLVSTNNEWSTLKSVVVGDATGANWPVNCPDFRKQEETTLWKETPVPAGPVEQQIIDEANEDLQNFADILLDLDVEVLRPEQLDFVGRDGMYNYCPRDRFLVLGDKVIDTPMAYGCRDMEREAYPWFAGQTIRPEDPQVLFDAANVCRLGEDLLYLVSESGNLAGAHWLQETFPEYRVHILDCYQGVHIDSTISPVREGLVVLNGSRINQDNCPEVLKSWDKIYIDEVVPQGFYNYPYASKWIALNFLTVSPNLVVCDPHQTMLREQLKKHSVNTIGCELRHSRTLGGGHHCTTLDLVRV